MSKRAYWLWLLQSRGGIPEQTQSAMKLWIRPEGHSEGKQLVCDSSIVTQQCLVPTEQAMVRSESIQKFVLTRCHSLYVSMPLAHLVPVHPECELCPRGQSFVNTSAALIGARQHPKHFRKHWFCFTLSAPWYWAYISEAYQQQKMQKSGLSQLRELTH